MNFILFYFFNLMQQEAEREKQLRERARRLIAEARQGINVMSWSSLDLPNSPASTSNNNYYFNYEKVASPMTSGSTLSSGRRGESLFV